MNSGVKLPRLVNARSLALLLILPLTATGCSDKKSEDDAASSCSQPTTTTSGVTASQSVRRQDDNQIILLTENGQPVGTTTPACITASTSPAQDPDIGTSGAGGSGSGNNAMDIPVDVTAITPAAGAASGGTVLTITGQGFDSKTSVLIGELACAELTIVSATTLQCTTAAHAAGDVTVTVADSGSQKQIPAGYRFGNGAILSTSSAISFAEIPMNWGSASVDLTVTNTGDLDATGVSAPALAAPFEFVSTNTYPGFYYNPALSCGEVIAPNATCKINIGFSPTAAGSFTGSVVISYNNGIQAATKSISLSGNGVVRGALAADFGSGGVVSANLAANGDDIFNDTIYLSDYNMLAVGYSRATSSADFRLAVRKYYSDGTADTSFGNGGAVNGPVPGCPNHDNALAAFEGSDGKITIIAECINSSWQSRTAVIRLTASGAMDTSFDGDGVKLLNIDPSHTVNPKTVAKDSSGRFYIGGYIDLTGGAWDSFVARLTSDGDLDGTFGTSGLWSTNQSSTQEVINGLTVASSGAVYATGRAAQSEGTWTVFKLTSSGALDTGFSTDGIVQIDITNGAPDVGWSVAMMPDGNVLVAGDSNSYLAMAKLNASTGALDATFGTSGIVHISGINAAGATAFTKVKIDPLNKIVGVGHSYDINNSRYDYLVARYSVTGALDTSFNNGVGFKTYQLDNTEAKPRSLDFDLLGRYIVGGYAGSTLPATAANGRVVVIWN